MLKTYEIKVDIEKDVSPSEIHFSVSRNDLDSIALLLEIVQDGTPFDLTGKTVEIGIRKPSGKTVFQAVEITSAVEGKASAILPIQAHVEYGIHNAEVYVRDADQMVVTSSFGYVARESIMDTTEIPSVNDWSALQQALFLYDKKPLLTDGIPTDVPEYVGQTAMDTTNKLFYVANDITANSWVPIGSGSGGDGGTGVVSWADILNKPITFPSDPHTHSIADVVGLQIALDGKQDAGTVPTHTHDFATGITGKPATYPPDAHGHTIADVSGLQAELNGKVDDAEMTGKADAIHTHAIGDVTGLQVALDGKMDDGDAYLKTETYAKTEVYNKAEVDAKTFDAGGTTVEDNLTSTSTTNALSSNQGRILNETKANTNHTHSYTTLTDIPEAFQPTAHLHNISHVRDLETTLGGLDKKSVLGTVAPTTVVPEYIGQTYLNTSTNEYYVATGTVAGAWHLINEQDVVTWAEVTEKPATFTPEVHTHAIADVTNLQTTLDGKVDDSEMAGKSDVGHTHDFGTEITGKPLTYPPEVHTHAIADVTNLQTTLDGKANTGHTHDFATGITGKPLTYPPDAHNHAIADVTNLQTTLDGKADAGHVHTYASITEKPLTFTPPLASGSVVGGSRVGNGLRMAGEYLTIREGFGILADPNDFTLKVDTTQTDARYVQNSAGQSLTMWKGTQTEYDAIVTKDPDTLYFIV